MRRREFAALVGGAVAWPVRVRAQQPTLPVIGFMSSRSPEDSQSVLAGLRKGLSEGGLVEGKNRSLHRFCRLPTS
jgi:putative ABC transport system substrate-binding protein